jgi:gliding motility-associated transport system ATP-binding protein
MEPGHAVTATAPVLSAGVGVRYESRWALRMASFLVTESDLGSAALGVVTRRSAAATALIHLLSGQVAPGYGSLRVLGYDMNSAAGRAAVSRQCGIASRSSRPVPGARVRGLVERAARRSGQPGADRHLLVAAILDRLALTPWADVPFGAAPEQVARKVRLAIACVHQPKLLLLDGLFDQLVPLDLTVLADVIRDLQRDTAVIALGPDQETLSLVCEQVIELGDGIVVGARPPPLRPPAFAWRAAVAATSGLGAPAGPGYGGG